MIRSIDEWAEIFRKERDMEQRARHLLGDLVAYRNGSIHEDQDIKQCINFMLGVAAFAGAELKQVFKTDEATNGDAEQVLPEGVSKGSV